MELTSSRQRRAMAAAISVGCVLVTLSTHEPSDLLVVVAIVCVCMGWKAGLGAVAAASLLSAAICCRRNTSQRTVLLGSRRLFRGVCTLAGGKNLRDHQLL